MLVFVVFFVLFAAALIAMCIDEFGEPYFDDDDCFEIKQPRKPKNEHHTKKNSGTDNKIDTGL